MARAVPLALATLAGLAAWLSLGVLAVVDRAGSERVGLLPPWWLLGASIVVFAAVVVAFRLPTVRLLPLALTVLPCLPWLPGRIPAAFLIWSGPLGGLVWVLVGIGLMGPALRRYDRAHWLTDPARAPWLAAAAAAVAFGTGALALQPRLPAGDEPHYLIITQSLLADGDLRIENNHARGGYFPYHTGELRPDYLQRGQDGQIYSIHAPGLSAVLAPAFAIGGYPASAAAMIAIAALGVAFLWIAVFHLTANPPAAWLAAASWGLSAPGYLHAFAIYPDGAGALCTIVGLWMLVRLERDLQVGARALAATGAVLAALPWLHTRFALIAGVLGIAIAARLMVRADRVRAIGLLMAVPILSAVAWFGYFWMIWGTPNPAAPYGHYTQSAWSHLEPGLPGLLFDQQFGLLPNAPVYGLAIAGGLYLARWHPRLAFEVALLVIPYTLAVASYRMWWGGLSAPTRFLVAVLPAAALPLGALAARAGRGWRAVAWLLVVLGAAMVIARILVDEGSLLYNARDGTDLLLDWANRSVDLPLAWPSLHRDAPLDALADVGIWAGAVFLAGAVGMGLTRLAGSAWTSAAVASALAVMLASTFVWGRHDQPVITPNTSMLALLQRLPSAGIGPGWQSRPWGFVEPSHVSARLLVGSSARGQNTTEPKPLFSAPLVPAGRYELVTAGAPRLEGRLTVTVGRGPTTIDTLDLADAWPDGGTPVLELPVLVRSLTLDGDARTRELLGEIVLKPGPPALEQTPVRGTARRAARYGPARVFFLDDDAFMEPAGFWTRGEASTDLVVDTLGAGAQTPGPLSLSVRGGAVPSEATFTSGGWTQRLALNPGETRLVELPALDGDGRVWRLRIETATGFRPGEHEPGSRDFRNLGVWVSVP